MNCRIKYAEKESSIKSNLKTAIFCVGVKLMGGAHRWYTHKFQAPLTNGIPVSVRTTTSRMHLVCTWAIKAFNSGRITVYVEKAVSRNNGCGWK
jgi:hypothetical protein